MAGDTETVERVVGAYRRLMRAIQESKAAQGDPWYDCPMTMQQLRALTLIAASERGLSSRELATMLGVGASAITPLVDRLVERGFTRRGEDAHDRRIARLHATETASAMLERMRAGQIDVIRSALAQLEPAELETVGAALDVLHAGIQRVAASTRPQPPVAEHSSPAPMTLNVTPVHPTRTLREVSAPTTLTPQGTPA